MPLLRVMQHELAPLGQWALNNLTAWTKPTPQTLTVGVVTDIARSERDLMLEIALLRQQVRILERKKNARPLI